MLVCFFAVVVLGGGGGSAFFFFFFFQCVSMWVNAFPFSEVRILSIELISTGNDRVSVRDVSARSIIMSIMKGTDS